MKTLMMPYYLIFKKKACSVYTGLLNPPPLPLAIKLIVDPYKSVRINPG